MPPIGPGRRVMIKIPPWWHRLRKKRKAGEHADLTRARLVPVARNFFLAVAPDQFTIRAFARGLHVVPATIRAHFKGGVDELQREIVRHVLTELALSCSPEHVGADYLGQVFRSAASRFRKQPRLGRLAMAELTNDPLLSPIFADRICSAIASLAPKRDLISGLELVCGRLAALVMIESGAWARGDAKAMGPVAPKEAKPKGTAAKGTPEKEEGPLTGTQMLEGMPALVEARLAALSPEEHPCLKSAPKLAASLAKRGKADYLDKQAVKAAKVVIAELTKSGK